MNDSGIHVTNIKRPNMRSFRELQLVPRSIQEILFSISAADLKFTRDEMPHANRFSIFTGSSRTRTPVAWWTAAVIAAAIPAKPISPIPRAPSSLISLSG